MACPRARHSGGSGGCSSTGRAPPLHGGGQGFESPHLHQARLAGASRQAARDVPEGMPRRVSTRRVSIRHLSTGTFQTEQKKRRVASIELSRGIGVSLGPGGSEARVEGSYFGRQVDA